MNLLFKYVLLKETEYPLYFWPFPSKCLGEGATFVTPFKESVLRERICGETILTEVPP